MRPHLAPPAAPPAAPGRNPAAPRRTPRRTPRRADTARLLLEWGAAAEAKDNRGRVALHAAAAGGASMVVAALLARGALPSVVAAGGLTPLDLAVYAPPPPAAAFTDGSTIESLLSGGEAAWSSTLPPHTGKSPTPRGPLPPACARQRASRLQGRPTTSRPPGTPQCRSAALPP